MNIVVREAKVGDEAAIAAIHVAAWRRAYAGVMPQELLDSLDVEQRRDMWRGALERPGKGSYIVAESDGIVEGFCVFGPARDEDLDGAEAAEIVAINISPEKWRVGLGSALLQYAVEQAGRSGHQSIYLWVVRENARAIQFYKRHGFVSDGTSKRDPKHSSIYEIRYVRT